MPTVPPYLALLLVGGLLAGTAASSNPEPELGRVRWGRDVDAALAQSRASGRPVLVLFDEVPGCATCRQFGQVVLSHPLLSEAIEHEFVPVFVANNRPGRDAAALARFGEPAWNNPVVRLLAPDGHDLVPRADGLYTAHAIAERLIAGLHAAGRPVPGYLSIAEQEARTAHRREATFAMACFWEGEARLGALPGVLAVEAVQLGNAEGVRVEYDESELTRAALVRAAAERACTVQSAENVRARPAGGSDHLHALAHSRYARLALTPMQAMRVNAALAAGTDPTEWLAPSQR